MRILHVLDHALPLHSGYTFRTLSILREQRALGWDTVHLTGPRQGPGPARETIDGWEFHRAPATGGWAERTPLARHWSTISSISKQLDRLLPELKPDLIHAHSPSLNACAALAAGRRHHLPVVYEVRAWWEDAAVDHGTTREGSLRYRLSRHLEDWALARSDAVTTICEGLRRDMIARGVDASRITVIPNAVDLAQFKPGAAPDQALAGRLGLGAGPILGFIGSFYAYEGLSILVDALPRLRAHHPQMQVLLAGGGPQEAALRKQVDSRGLQGEVVFAGRVAHDEVTALYDLVDLLVYPRLPMRLTELVTPLKPLEAMAQGRLLLASDVGGHAELLEDGKNAFLFKAGDGDALVARVLDVLARRDEWEGVRQRARQHVQENRQWKNSVQRYEPVYRALLRGNAA